MNLREEILRRSGLVVEEAGIKKIPYGEFSEIMRQRNLDVKEGKEKEHLVGYIVYKPNSFTWNDKYNDVEDRTMVVDSDNKIYDRDALGYSLYGKILSGGPRDIVRIERMPASSVDYCYFKED